MYSASKSARSNRNSVFKKSNTQAIISLRAKIKSLDKSSDGSSTLDYDPYTYGVEVTQEQIIIYDKSKTIRRAYLLENPYKIGWVVDCDLHVCMLCWREFAWYRGRTKHHCRACGALVCHDCSPYTTDIPMLMEEKGSRVCKNCFGLKSGIFTPLGNESPKPRPAAVDTASANLFETPKQSVNTTPSKSNKRFSHNKLTKLESEEKMMQKYLEEMEKIDQEQLPKYEEAYRIMREIIPLDIYKTKVTRLIRRGLPEDCANRIWNTKILWLIVTHPEDIKKIHLADFRSKYFYDGLDIIEMRAIWYNLPKWNFQSDNPLEKGKAEWRDGFKSKLDDLAYKEAIGKLSPQHIRHAVYEEVDYLHLFDPTLPLLPRFHRSASYNQNAIVSPAGEDPTATPDPTDQYSPFCDPIDNIQDRKKKYMNNFATQSGSEERREKKYRTLLEEINAEPVDDVYEDDDDYYGEQLDYDDEEEEEEDQVVAGGLRRGDDDISSLEDGSTDELYAQRQQRPYSNQKAVIKERDNDSRASSYRTPANNKQQKGGLQSSNSASDLSGMGRNGGNKYTSPAAGKSLHSAQAIHSAMMKDNYSHSSDTAQLPKSAMKQSIPTNQSIASSVSTLSNPTYGKSAPSLATTNTVKFKSAEIAIQQHNSASKAEKGYKERMSKSLQSSSALMKAYSFHGEGSASNMASSYQNTSSVGNKKTLDSNRMSPLRVTSNNTLANRNRSTSGAGKRDLSPTQLTPTMSGLSQSLLNSPNDRDYPILKPRISLETPTNAPMTFNGGNGVDPYATPNSVETIPGQYYQPTTEKWKSSNRKFTTINHIDLETPASNTFTTVDSIKSYKFLSTSKKRIPNISDFDSPNIFSNNNVYHTDEEEEEEEASGSHPMSSSYTASPVIAPNTNYIPISSAKNPQATLRYQTPTSNMNNNNNNNNPVAASSRTPSATLRPFQPNNNSNNTNTTTTTPGRSTSRAASSNGIPSHTPSTINTNNPNLTLQKLRYKEEIKLYLLIGNITKTISILNETNTRLSDYFTIPEATDLLWQCLNTENITDTPLINQSILFLLDEKMIDINSQNMVNNNKTSILQITVLQDNEYLGRELIRRGADILLCDKDGLCPLSISLTYHYDWVMNEFTASGRELQLLKKGSSDIKFQYITFFILAGYAKKAYEIIQEGYITITPEEATELLSSCRGNFANMKDPIETFELLETLGASMVDFE